MQRIFRNTLALLVCVLFATSAVDAQHMPGKNQKDKAGEDKKEKGEIKEVLSETSHSVLIDGQKVSYHVTTGTMALKESIDDPKAGIFFIAYTRTDGVTAKDNPAKRPVTFSFNGGPGSSSVWLHLGLLGPRRINADSMGNASAPPYELVDNQYSLLDKTDLVFIDPVSTGFRRAAKGEDAHQFHGVREDVQSVGEFIRLYTTKYERWASPKFLIGESYGTTRAAGLSGYLQDKHGMYLNGIMLISSILNFETASFTTGNDLPYILFLPSYTATAWYHKRLPADLQSDLTAALKESENFALGDYATALMQGDEISEATRKSVTHELARLTGLSEEYIEQTNLRILIHRFTKELLRDQRRTVGRLDSRFTGIDSDAAGEYSDYDPSYANILGEYSATMNDYLRRDLKFKSDLPYEILTGKVHPWNYDNYKNRFVNVGETLRQAMTKNPFLKVFVANGYFDLATPYLATRYTFDHLGLDPSLRDNVSMGYYTAGHMMYIKLSQLAKLHGDLVKFMDGAMR